MLKIEKMLPEHYQSISYLTFSWQNISHNRENAPYPEPKITKNKN
jgi:hypothetical protein